jgi:hypothetical protein
MARSGHGKQTRGPARRCPSACLPSGHGDDETDLSTPRTTLASRYVRVLMTCWHCSHQADADLPALIASGRGDVPLVRLRCRCARCRSARGGFTCTGRDAIRVVPRITMWGASYHGGGSLNEAFKGRSRNVNRHRMLPMRGERYNNRRAILRHFEVKRADPVGLHFRHGDFLPTSTGYVGRWYVT